MIVKHDTHCKWNTAISTVVFTEQDIWISGYRECCNVQMDISIDKSETNIIL